MLSLPAGCWAAEAVQEVNHPLAAILTSAEAAQRWLAGDAPNLAEARDAIAIIIGNSRRAADILVEVRDLVDTPLSAPTCSELDGQAAGMASSGWGALRQNLALAWQRLRSNRLLLAGSIQ